MTRRLAALVLSLAVVLSGCSVLGGGTYDLDVEFSRAFNLFPQSPVRIRGVEVGQIVELTTSPGSDVVTVTLRLEDDVELSPDTSAVVITASLLGERYVQLVDGTESGTLQDGDTIPLERTIVPFEFDEVLEGLNDFVGGLDEDEVARLVTNLAQLLEGNGTQLGETIDAASGAVAALKENDEELVALASSVADLNDTLATRDDELADLLADWVRVSDTLTSETTDLDGALDNLVVLTREIAELMIEHREELSSDIDTVTRVGRSLDRNLGEFSKAILGSAELFRHAERVIDRESNMLPLVNHGEQLGEEIAVSLANRLEGLCLAAGGTDEECALDLEGGEFGGDFCFEPLVPCASADSFTLTDVVVSAVEQQPSIGDQLLKRREERRTSGDASAEDQAIDDALEQLGLLDEEEGA